ncbi:MAG: carbonate dehydratase [Bacteroidota bacterium]|nr:carbonate dehydratase [Bacteroidota bacterium]MDX5426757.1 carbonate dehydratase [Bacteroidota bacterium]MDX5504747.1 carbonate dehydratase [Bacteroidota bacterium]
MNEYEKLLLQNKAWSEEMRQHDEKFFSRLSDQQSPRFLWIGCSDSRVPANEITGTHPGEIFVQRNIANLVVPTDLNLLSVLQYAVNVLEVKHIIVCGHYGCGGVQAAMGHQSFGLINKWLRRIKEVYRLHQDELESIEDNKARQDRLVELNVIEQCHELTKTSIVQKAWKKRQGPKIHGWVYGLKDGLLNDLISIDPTLDNIDDIFRFTFDGPDE